MLVKESNVCAMYIDGKPVSEIADVNLETVDTLDDGDDAKQTFDMMNQEMEIEVPLSRKAAQEMRRMFIPRGVRNARILRRDGYLGPDNAEMI